MDLIDGTNSVKLESSPELSYTDHIFVTKVSAGYDKEGLEERVRRLNLACIKDTQILSNNCECTAGLSTSECTAVTSRCEKKFSFRRDDNCPDL